MVLVTVTSDCQHNILSMPQPESGAPKTPLTSFLVQSGVPTRISPWEAVPQSKYGLSTPRGRVPAWGRAGPPTASAQGGRSPSSHHSTWSPSAGTLGPAEPASPGSAPPQPRALTNELQAVIVCWSEEGKSSLGNWPLSQTLFRELGREEEPVTQVQCRLLQTICNRYRLLMASSLPQN